MRPEPGRIPLPRRKCRRRDDHRHHDAGARGQVGVEGREPCREHDAPRATRRADTQAAVRRWAARVAGARDVAAGERRPRGRPGPKPYHRHASDARPRPEHGRANASCGCRAPRGCHRDQRRPAGQTTGHRRAVREADVAADIAGCDQRPRQPDPQLRGRAGPGNGGLRGAVHDRQPNEDRRDHQAVLRRHCRLCRRWPPTLSGSPRAKSQDFARQKTRGPASDP